MAHTTVTSTTPQAEAPQPDARQHPHTTQAGVTWQQLTNRLINDSTDLLKLAKLDGDPQLMAGHEALNYVIGMVDECAGEERREQRAAQNSAQTHQTGTRLTAEQRGGEWMAKWGCPGWCVEEHGTRKALDCHSTKPIETVMRAADIDSSGYSAGTDNLPWLTAQVVQHDQEGEELARRTDVWLGFGLHLAEISPAEARRALDSLRAFTAQLAAVVDFAEQVAAEDTPAVKRHV